MITDSKLDKWIQAGVNVLIEGPHGIGKSERVIEAMHRNKKKFLYFSAPTMDPYIDFLGVPRVVEHNDKRWLEFIKPAAMQAEDIEFIIFDEYNRAPKKVRNATMEILQFKSINGMKMPNLKAIWGMVNPTDEDDTYDVEEMDAAQRDRFQIQVAFPNSPDAMFFESKYGLAGKIGCKWWNSLSPQQIKDHLISPRRLSYVLEGHLAGLDISDMLPNSVNVTMLKTELNSVGLYQRLAEFKKMTTEQIKEEIKQMNVRSFILDEVAKKTLPTRLLDAYPSEDLIPLLKEATTKHMLDYFVAKMSSDEDLVAIVSKMKHKNGTLGSQVKYEFELAQAEKAREKIFQELKTKDIGKIIDKKTKAATVDGYGSVKNMQKHLSDYLKKSANSKNTYEAMLDELELAHEVCPIFEDAIAEMRIALNMPSEQDKKLEMQAAVKAEQDRLRNEKTTYWGDGYTTFDDEEDDDDAEWEPVPAVALKALPYYGTASKPKAAAKKAAKPVATPPMSDEEFMRKFGHLDPNKREW